MLQAAAVFRDADGRKLSTEVERTAGSLGGPFTANRAAAAAAAMMWSVKDMASASPEGSSASHDAQTGLEALWQTRAKRRVQLDQLRHLSAGECEQRVLLVSLHAGTESASGPRADFGRWHSRFTGQLAARRTSLFDLRDKLQEEAGQHKLAELELCQWRQATTAAIVAAQPTPQQAPSRLPTAPRDIRRSSNAPLAPPPPPPPLLSPERDAAAQPSSQFYMPSSAVRPPLPATTPPAGDNERNGENTAIETGLMPLHPAAKAPREESSRTNRGQLVVAGKVVQFEVAGFGMQGSFDVSGTAVRVEPPQAEFELINAAAVQGSIAVVVRGTVSFVSKARRVMAAGAIAMVVINNTDVPLCLTRPQDDLASDVNIPVVCVGKNAGIHFPRRAAAMLWLLAEPNVSSAAGRSWKPRNDDSGLERSDTEQRNRTAVKHSRQWQATENPSASTKRTGVEPDLITNRKTKQSSFSLKPTGSGSSDEHRTTWTTESLVTASERSYPSSRSSSPSLSEGDAAEDVEALYSGGSSLDLSTISGYSSVSRSANKMFESAYDSSEPESDMDGSVKAGVGGGFHQSAQGMPDMGRGSAWARTAYLIDKFVQSMAIFQCLEPDERLCMAEVLKPVTFQPGNIIIHQGVRGSRALSGANFLHNIAYTVWCVQQRTQTATRCTF
eukprot:SAG31_NODE_384_length_16414_cov_7.492308_10_plen_670_part_00